MNLKELEKIFHKEAMKRHYQNNLEKYRKKYYCNCGGQYTLTSKSRHLSTIIHQEYLSNL
jgi:hypothetical protein